jgi:hypothetical protein
MHSRRDERASAAAGDVDLFEHIRNIAPEGQLRWALNSIRKHDGSNWSLFTGNATCGIDVR